MVTIGRSSPEVYAGGILTLTCIVVIIPEVDTPFSVTTEWFHSEESLVDDIRTTLVAAEQLSRLVFRTEVTLDPVSQSQDSGLYMCEVSITPADSTGLVEEVRTFGSDELLEQQVLSKCAVFNMSVMTSITPVITLNEQTLLIIVYCLGPFLSMEVTPQSSVVLDVTPHNSATFTCLAAQPSSVIVEKQLGWTRTIAGITEELVNNGASVKISSSDVGSPVSKSTLSVILGAGSIGIASYTCISTLNIPGDLLLTESATATLTVKGEFCILLLCLLFPYTMY